MSAPALSAMLENRWSVIASHDSLLTPGVLACAEVSAMCHCLSAVVCSVLDKISHFAFIAACEGLIIFVTFLFAWLECSDPRCIPALAYILYLRMLSSRLGLAA